MPDRSAPRPPMGGLRHPVWLAIGAALGLAGSWIVALGDVPPAWELDLTGWINDVPDVVAWMTYLPMQLGTIGAALGVCVVVAVVGRDRLLGAVMAGAVLVTWLLTRMVKSTVDRGRPGAFLTDIDVRDVVRSDLGFASSHSSVAGATAIMAMAALPHRWRWVAPAMAGLVGIGRIVHGVHLPADVVGGWSLGTLVALAGLSAVDRLDSRSERDPR